MTSNNKNKSGKGDKKSRYIVSFTHHNGNNIVFSEAALGGVCYQSEDAAFYTLVQEVISRLWLLFPPDSPQRPVGSAVVSLDRESLTGLVGHGDSRYEYAVRGLEEAHE